MVSMTVDDLEKLKKELYLKAYDDIRETIKEQGRCHYALSIQDPANRQHIRDVRRKAYWKKKGMEPPENPTGKPGRGRPRKYISDNLDDIELLMVKLPGK